MLCVCFAFLAPGGRDEVISNNPGITRIRGFHVTIAVRSHKRPFEDVAHPALEWSTFCRAKIARILAPESSDAGLNRVAGSNSREPHPVALRKAVPVRAILAGPVDQRSETRAEQSAHQTFRADCTFHGPI